MLVAFGFIVNLDQIGGAVSHSGDDRQNGGWGLCLSLGRWCWTISLGSKFDDPSALGASSSLFLCVSSLFCVMLEMSDRA